MNNIYSKLLLLTLLFTGLFTACNPYGEDQYSEIIVVESYLIAEQSLPAVLVSRTLPIDQTYSFEAAAIGGATVSITLEAEAGSDDGRTFEYIMVQPGIYMPNGSLHEVLPGRTYRLNVTDITGHGPIEASTRVPAAFEVLGDIPDQLTYQGQQLEVTISPNDNPGRQNIYVFTTIADDPRYENLTPFYEALIDEDEEEIGSLEKNASFLINEENFEVNEDRSVNLSYPWIAVAFYGINQIVAHSLDTNTADFIRSQDVQLGGSTLSPGEIPNLIYHVDGGIGVFGSASADTISVNIVR